MLYGYVIGKLLGKGDPLLLLFFGALPDFDLYSHFLLQKFFNVKDPYGTLFGHHGIAHSWLLVSLIFLPFGFRFIPYFLSTLQHILFGDLVTNEVPLIFPFSLEQFGLRLYLSWPSLILEFLSLPLFLLLLRKENSKKRGKFLIILAIPLIFLDLYHSLLFLYQGSLFTLYSLYGLVASIILLSFIAYQIIYR